MLSNEELIALLSNQPSVGSGGDIIVSTVPVWFENPGLVYPPALNYPFDIYITGYGFLPGMSTEIAGLNVIEFEAINFFKVRIRLSVTNFGSYPCQFFLDNQLVDSYNSLTLTFSSRFTTNGWLDFRNNTYILSNYQTSSNGQGIEQSSLGVKSLTGYSDLFVAIDDDSFPVNSQFTFESICYFFSGSHTIWTGLTSITPNWLNPRNTVLGVNSLENRAYSRCFYGVNNQYQNIDNTTGSNWNNNYIHTVIDYNNGLINVSAYSRASLSYDWNIASDGEFIFSQQYQTQLATDGFYPCVYFQAANSSSTLVAYKVS